MSASPLETPPPVSAGSVRWGATYDGAEPALKAAWGLPAFVAFELLCQILPLFGVPLQVRTGLRVAAFGASLVLLVLLSPRGRLHPASRWALLIVAILAVQLFHPTSNTLLASAAQSALYVAILGPLFWVSRLDVHLHSFRQALGLLWCFHSASATTGVFQVVFPGILDFPVSPVLMQYGSDYVESLKIITSSGRWVFRPMGFSDIPGGAGNSGMYAVILGMGFLLTSRNWVRSFAPLTILIGALAIYLSQVRALLVVTLIFVLCLLALLIIRRDYSRALLLGGGVALAAAAGLVLAMRAAGPAVATRLQSLTFANPAQVYYTNRGVQMKAAVEELLPQYGAFGAGLGRWGMIRHYFGDSRNADSEAIWAELQWVAWLLDGGVMLVLAYTGALAATLLFAWRLSRLSRSPALRDWGLILFSYNLGVFALTFSYVVFIGQTGLEFWLLNAAAFAAAQHVARQDPQSALIP